MLSVILAFYIATFSLGVFISLSIPFNTSTYPKHIAEIQFNEEMFTGSVNGISVQNLIALRVSAILAMFFKTVSSLVNFLPRLSSWAFGRDTLSMGYL